MQAASLLPFALLVSVLVVGSADQFGRVKRGISDLTEGIVKRHKRQLDSSRSCSQKCQGIVEENIRGRTGTKYHGFENPFAMLNDGFEDAGIEVICEEFEKSKNCFDECDRPSGVVGYYQFICEHKQGVKDHSPCYRQAKNEVNNVCIKECSNSAFIKALAVTKTSSSNTTAGVLKQLDALRPMCKFFNCAVDCARRIFDKQCTNDSKAGSFFREIGVAGQKTALSGMETLDNELGTNLMPEECAASISPKVCPCPALDNLVVKTPESAKGALLSLLNGLVSYSPHVDDNNCTTGVSCTLPKGLPPTIVFRGVLNHRSVHGRMNQPRVQSLMCDAASGAWMLPAEPNDTPQAFLQFTCLSIRIEIAYLFPAAATEHTK